MAPKLLALDAFVNTTAVIIGAPGARSRAEVTTLPTKVTFYDVSFEDAPVSLGNKEDARRNVPDVVRSFNGHLWAPVRVRTEPRGRRRLLDTTILQLVLKGMEAEGLEKTNIFAAKSSPIDTSKVYRMVSDGADLAAELASKFAAGFIIVEDVVYGVVQPWLYSISGPVGAGQIGVRVQSHGYHEQASSLYFALPARENMEQAKLFLEEFFGAPSAPVVNEHFVLRPADHAISDEALLDLNMSGLCRSMGRRLSHGWLSDGLVLQWASVKDFYERRQYDVIVPMMIELVEAFRDEVIDKVSVPLPAARSNPNRKDVRLLVEHVAMMYARIRYSDRVEADPSLAEMMDGWRDDLQALLKAEDV